MTTMYDLAREEYAALGIDTEAVMEKLAAKPISVHCWQGDDVLGFDQEGAPLRRHPDHGQLPRPRPHLRGADAPTSKPPWPSCPAPSASTCTPPTPSSPTRTPGSTATAMEYKHFEPWVAWAQGARLRHRLQPHHLRPSHDEQRVCRCPRPDEATRRLLDRATASACRKISQQIGEALDDQTLCNIWIPDGLKDVPGDRYGLRERLKRFAGRDLTPRSYDRVIDSRARAKVFGIGVESDDRGLQRVLPGLRRHAPRRVRPAGSGPLPSHRERRPTSSRRCCCSSTRCRCT